MAAFPDASESNSSRIQRSRPGYATRLLGCALGCATLTLLVIVGALLGYTFRRAWLPVIGEALGVQPELRNADVIIVLGGGDGDRYDYGSYLYHHGFSDHLIATGAPVGTQTAAINLVQRGVPREAITLANGTQNTRGDALRSRELMQEHGWHTALLVTDPYHIRRSLWTFQTAFAGSSLEVWPAPVVGGWFHADRWWQSENGFIAVNDEYLKLAYYLARGYIAPSVLFGHQS